MKASLGTCRGLTAVELLVATLIGGVVLASAVALLRQQGRTALVSQAAVAAIGTAAWAAQIAARDVALAGADPMRVGLAPLVEARPDRLVLQSDRNGDGSIDPASAERVTLAWSPAGGGSFVRALGRQSMAIASGVGRDDLRFRYFREDGSEIGSAGGSLAPEDLPRARRVVIELGVAGNAAGEKPVRAEVHEGAMLRARRP